MSLWRALGELWATLQDILQCGDVVGHLVALGAVPMGTVTDDSTVQEVVR